MLPGVRGREQAAPVAYAGRDRRGSAAPKAVLHRGSFIGAGTAVLALLLALTILGAVAPLERHLAIAAADTMLSAGTAALAILLGVLLLLRFRLTGDAVALWIAAGVLTFAVFLVGAGQLLLRLDADAVDTSVMTWVRPASVAVIIGLFLWALRVPEVDTRLRPHLLLLGAFGAVLWVAFLLQLLPVLRRLLAGATPVDAGFPERVATEPLMIAAWTALAIVYLWRGIRSQRALAAWLGLMLYALAAAEFASALVLQYGSTWTVGAGALRLMGCVFGLVGVVRELQLAYAAQNDRLLQSRVDALTQEARIEAQRAEQAERAHEARNALTAIEGATLTLERHREALDPDLRATLAAAVATEIARLQRIVSAERADGTLGAFDLRRVIEEQLALLHSRGGHAMAHLPARLPALGRAADTAQALQNLLVNAQKYAPGTPVVVRATAEDDRVVVQVEDRGPGVAPHERERIFGRGERAAGGDGDGLGLYVARQLMREQGGDLWLEDPRGSTGATFALALPRSAGGEQLPHQGGDVAGAVDAERAAVLADLDHG